MSIAGVGATAVIKNHVITPTGNGFAKTGVLAEHGTLRATGSYISHGAISCGNYGRNNVARCFFYESGFGRLYSAGECFFEGVYSLF